MGRPKNRVTVNSGLKMEPAKKARRKRKETTYKPQRATFNPNKYNRQIRKAIKPRFTESNQSKAEMLYVDRGFSYAQVAAYFQVPKHVIWWTLKERGVISRTNSETKKGWNNPMAGMTGIRSPKYGRTKDTFNSKKMQAEERRKAALWLNKLYRETADQRHEEQVKRDKEREMEYQKYWPGMNLKDTEKKYRWK